MVKFVDLFKEAYEKYYDWDRTRSQKENEVKLENFSKVIDNSVSINEYLDE